jgi:hypothetical protein
VEFVIIEEYFLLSPALLYPAQYKVTANFS